MQREFEFTGGVNRVFNKSKVGINKGIEINKSNVAFFGGTDKNYLQTFTTNISGFVTAAKCPKLFKHFTLSNNNFEYRFGQNPVYFPIGTKLDKYARTFINYSFAEREEKFDNLRNSLKEEIYVIINNHINRDIDTVIKKSNENELVDEVLNAFDNFCETFKNAKNAKNHFAYDKMYFSIGNLELNGQIDLFLINNSNDGFVLLDLKMKKFGNPISDFKLADFIQVLLYAYGLRKEKKLPIDSIGYYFLFENELVIEKMTNLEEQDCWELLENLVDELIHTVNFVPRKCELCLICPLKKECKVGKTLTAKDFIIPLQI